MDIVFDISLMCLMAFTDSQRAKAQETIWIADDYVNDNLFSISMSQVLYYDFDACFPI